MINQHEISKRDLVRAVSRPEVRLSLLFVSMAAALVSCSSSTDYNFENSVAEAEALVAPAATFDPANGSPFPNSLLFAPSPGEGPDGTLNLPVADPTDLTNPVVALNAMDGFSTTEPVTTGFSQPLDGTSLVIGSSVRVFEVTTDPDPANLLAVTSVIRELTSDEVIAVAPGAGKTLAIVPRIPLKESTDYMVVLNNQIEDSNDNPMGRSLTFSLLAGEEDFTDPQFAAIQGLTRVMLLVASTQGIDPDSVTMAWSFRTQSTTPTLQAVKNASTASNIAVQAIPGATSPAGLADLMAGTLDVPYYQTAPSDENALAPLQGFWTTTEGANITRFTPMPAVRSTQTIPVLMSVPNANATAVNGMTQPPDGWPIAIFQHGITQNRTNMLAIADRMAGAGFAVIAIDLPLHGITDTSQGLYLAGLERTFDLDANVITADGMRQGDGVIDDSGDYFYNLQNLLNSRDNFRQGIADIWVLSASIANLPGIDANRKAFIGHSLGAIIGSTMLAFDDSFKSATLAMPGGGLARLLLASTPFGQEIANGLAAAGIEVLSPRGQQFLNATQTLLDSADPVNHAARTAANAPIHLTQMLQDEVVVGTVPGAALSGTVPLASLMQLPIVNSTSSGDSWVQFVTGAHSAILVADDPAFEELQTQMATFAATQGATMPVGDAALLQAPPNP